MDISKKTWLTEMDCMEYLSVKRLTLKDLREKQGLPFYNPIGGQKGRRYKRSEIDSWVEKSKIESVC